ncbi:MFS transporter [Actinopolyspora mortivallis]|uniref:MFS transporter n=1 Tax=Actinopolyspora mortivallis TaxID=33906 RepID=A0A2T0GX77_ACTMO|nr:MFS transporter [Actinopolyspora mortivallis]PRW63623.1 MFS transporter [Actinopolyspora mortivallis]
MATHRKTALVTLLLASTLAVMAGAILTPVLEVIRGDLGVTGTAAGLIITAHGLVIALSSPLWGWAIDRWGVRLPLAGGLALYGLAGGAGVLTSSYPALIASRLLFGLGAAAVFTGTTVALLNLFRGEERDRVMGWRATATSLGGVLWPLLGGAVGGFSWHAPFAIYLVGVPLGFAVLGLPFTSNEEEGRGARVARGGTLRLWRRRPLLLGLYGMQLVTAVLMYALIVFLPQRLSQIGIEAPLLVSLYNVTMSAVMSLVGLVYATMRAHLGYETLFRITLTSWVAAFLLLATTSHPLLIAAAPALLGLGQGIALPAITSLVGDTAPPQLRGQATSVLGTVTFAGQFASPLLLGPLVRATSIPAAYLASAGVAGIVLVLLLVTRVSWDSPPNVEPAPSPEPVRPVTR